MIKKVDVILKTVDMELEERRKTIYWFYGIALYGVLVYVSASVQRMPLGVNEFIKYFHSVCGIYLLTKICKAFKGNKYVLYIGQNTVLCFAFHGKIFSVLQVLIKKLFEDAYAVILENSIISALFQIVLTVIVSFILIVPIYVVNKYFPFVVGRPYKNSIKSKIQIAERVASN